MPNYRSYGMEPDSNSSSGRFQRLVEDELARLAPLMKSTGLKRTCCSSCPGFVIAASALNLSISVKSSPRGLDGEFNYPS